MKKQTLIVLALLSMACKKSEKIPVETGGNEARVEAINYPQEMRNFVIGLSGYAKKINPAFKVIPQNGIELVTTNTESSGTPDVNYLKAIDGNGQEDLYYGYDADNQATPASVTAETKSFLDISKNAGKTILVTDYCSTTSKMQRSYDVNNANGYISFAADKRGLFNVPTYPSKPYLENANVITTLGQAKNFLYLINGEKFDTKSDFINKVRSTNYDVLLMDLYHNGNDSFTSAEVNALRNKANGGKRLVIAYMSIGEAEDYRYYWKSSWETNRPAWLGPVNPKWPGNYEVKYWYKDWQNIIYGNDSSYLKKILNAGFDGVYLDIIDAFKLYE